jgi:hypothetical protein
MGDRGMISRHAIVMRFTLVLALVVVIATGSLFLLGWKLRKELHPDPVTVATASLQAVREQAVLVPFAARFVAVVTSEEHRFGLSAKKTLIMPGMVRYELDLAALRQRDLAWDPATRTLTVTLPPLHISQPDVDLRDVQTYGQGGVLMALTDVGSELDAANKAAGQGELMRQAREQLPMRLARHAALNAIERSFAMPLKAAGIEATVTAKFAGE